MIRAELIDLNQLVGGIDELLGSTLRESIEFRVHPSARLWPVRADPGQIVQIILDLALNARDTMPDGGLSRSKPRT